MIRFFTETLEPANEEGSFPVRVNYGLDYNGSAITPTTMTWTLTDKDGTIINSREDVSISSPSTENEVFLSGDDLAIQSGETSKDEVSRYLLMEGTYAVTIGSTTYTGKPIKGEYHFKIKNLKDVS